MMANSTVLDLRMSHETMNMYMDEAQFDDLKLFISTTVGQAEANLRSELASKSDLKKVEQLLTEGIVRLEEKVDDGFGGVGEAIDNLGAKIDELFDGHEERITKLERTLGIGESAA